ncbi:MAG: hypothetical protein ACFNUL_04880 [Cardiobacterium hominis]|jgi:hypothetical protein
MNRSNELDTLCGQVLLLSAFGGVFLGMGGFIAQSMFWLGCGLTAIGFGFMTWATLMQVRLRREALALEEEALRLTIESLYRDILDMLTGRHE